MKGAPAVEDTGESVAASYNENSYFVDFILFSVFMVGLRCVPMAVAEICLFTETRQLLVFQLIEIHMVYRCVGEILYGGLLFCLWLI